MKSTTALFTILLFFAASPFTWSQKEGTLAERLGYPADAKLLIVHADDIGLAHSVNSATIEAFEKGGISSGSVMVPCPWFDEFASYYREHPGLDVGVHLTLNAEWERYKWDGVMSSGEIPSLLDENGYFYATVEEVALHADPEEVEKELRAQIDRAIAFGIDPTHIDTHMGSVVATPELTEIYLKLGKEYGIPVMLPQRWLQSMPEEQRDHAAKHHALVNGIYMMYSGSGEMNWSESYGRMLAQVGPGLNVMIVHLARDNDEMRAVAANHPDFGSAWRQRDLDVVTGQQFTDLMQQHGIHLVTWKEIKALKDQS